MKTITHISFSLLACLPSAARFLRPPLWLAVVWLAAVNPVWGAPLDLKWTNSNLYLGPNPSGAAIGPDGTSYVTTSGGKTPCGTTATG